MGRGRGGAGASGGRAPDAFRVGGGGAAPGKCAEVVFDGDIVEADGGGAKDVAGIAEFGWMRRVTLMGLR